MSEELLQTTPKRIGRYTYYRLGSTTLDQLQAHGIIPRTNYGRLRAKKPDGLVSYHKNIKAVVEYKQPAQLKSPAQIAKAIDQELPVAKVLCKLLIVTDGTKSFWINALNGDRISDHTGNEVCAVFHPFGANNTTIIEQLIEDIDASISLTTSQIRTARIIDPSPLAKRLWQTIWVATGKSPVKCLYNVVELFIFKFLSDLRVLPDDVAFDYIYEKAEGDPKEALDYYARNSRTRIFRLFPAGNDGTTIINGTIFVSANNEPNLSQSILFQRCLNHLNDHAEEFGSLTTISKQFKTKLYESFLQQEVEALGQYFTPRRLIQSMIRMSGIDQPSFMFSQKRICDPFCGVGGFLLEILNMNDRILKCYEPSAAGRIEPPFVIRGFDKGFERDDERTVILAKANMLIYLTEILFRNPQCASEFARIFNETFTLFRDNLGTFGHIIKLEEERFDLVMSNPPYVTSGSSIIKEEIGKTPHTANEYPISGLGLESLALEWIIKSLKKGGQAYIVIPDGILARVNGDKLRNHILRKCYLDAIISLPMRTFFSNFENTYIIVLTKKHSTSDVQSHPVFTYLVSNIGEQLTSVKREEIEEDDLPEMEHLFRMFMSTKDDFEVPDNQLRCKIQPVERFRDETHWVIDRWWTNEEKAKIFGTTAHRNVKKENLDRIFHALQSSITDFESLVVSEALPVEPVRFVRLGDTTLFRTFLGKRILKSDLKYSEGDIPVYSANVFQPMGYGSATRIGDFSSPSILWGIDGNYNFNIIPAGAKFETTDHCGTIQILNSDIIPEYILSALHSHKIKEYYDRSFRPSLFNVRRIEVPVPLMNDGQFDVGRQRIIAERFQSLQDKTDEIELIRSKLDNLLGSYLDSKRWLT